MHRKEVKLFLIDCGTLTPEELVHTLLESSFRLRVSSPCQPRAKFQIQTEDLLTTKKQADNQVVKKIIYVITLTLLIFIEIGHSSKSAPIDRMITFIKNIEIIPKRAQPFLVGMSI